MSKRSYFDIWHFWKSYCWLRLIWGLEHRSRSRSRRKVLLGAGAGAGAGILPRSRSRSRSRPKMSRLRIPAIMLQSFMIIHKNKTKNDYYFLYIFFCFFSGQSCPQKGANLPQCIPASTFPILTVLDANVSDGNGSQTRIYDPRRSLDEVLCRSIWSNRIPLQSSPIDLGSHRIRHARAPPPKKKNRSQAPQDPTAKRLERIQDP